MLILPRRFYEQPQGTVDIRPDMGIPAFAVVAGQGAIAGLSHALVDGVTTEVHRGGIAYGGATSTNLARITLPDTARFYNKSGTMAAIIRCSSFTAGSPHLFSVRDGGTFSLLWHVDSGGLIKCYVSPTVSAASSTGVLADGVEHVAVTTWGSSGQRIFVDGVLVASNSDATLPGNNTITPCVLNRSTGNRGFQNGVVFAIAGVEGQVSDAQAQELSRSQYEFYGQLFRAIPRRIYFDLAAGGGTTLSPGLLTNEQSFFGPTLSTTVTVSPGLYTNEQTFFAPTVTNGTTIQPPLVENAQTFFGPTVSAAYTVTPGLFNNAQTFFSPTVTQGVTLLPELFINTQSFFTPSVATTYTITPALFTNDQTFFAPEVIRAGFLEPPLVTNEQTFFGPTVSATYTLTPGLFTNSASFFAPTVSNGFTLQPTLVENAQTFFAPSVSTAITLSPALFSNDSVFFAPTVSQPGTRTLTAQDLIDIADKVWSDPRALTLARFLGLK